MNITQSISCPLCHSKDFIAKYEATYVYTYKINTHDTKSFNDNSENLPFLFDRRDISCNKQYVECAQCGSQYPCSFELNANKIDFTILQKAIRADHKAKPQFWG